VPAILKYVLLYPALVLLAILAGLNIWGGLTLGTLEIDLDSDRNKAANRTVMVFGATGSVGDGLLKAVLEDEDVEKIYVVTRRNSSRIDAAVSAGRIEVIMHQDFTDYRALKGILRSVNTVMWALGTSSFNVDDETYTRIHVDFPVTFVKQWLALRTYKPMAFHYVTGMGTDPDGSAHWAREKGRAERELAALAEDNALRTFSYRSGYIRPTNERAHPLAYVLEWLLTPGDLVITARELGQAMLEMGVRWREQPNGTLVDNADSVLYAWRYSYERN
jgi:hypothetical protein